MVLLFSGGHMPRMIWRGQGGHRHGRRFLIPGHVDLVAPSNCPKPSYFPIVDLILARTWDLTKSQTFCWSSMTRCMLSMQYANLSTR